MKSSFLLSLVFSSMFFGVALAQSSKPKKNPVKKTTVPAPAPERKVIVTQAASKSDAPAAEKSSFDKFYERLSIGYFGVLTTPTLEDWDSRNAAISPEFSAGTNKDSYALNIWNQVNFGYNFGAKMKFNVIPRFTIFANEAPDQDPGERGMILLEDALIGFSGVVLSSEDKKFNWWMRPGLRLPTSHASRHFNNNDFGRLSYNLELTNVFTYDFNPTWQLGLIFQDRYWIFDQRYNASRHRLYMAPNFTYSFNETTKFQAYYELMQENNKRWKSINGLEPRYVDVWQNVMVGIYKDITPKFNIYPFVSAFVNDVPFGMRSMFLGAWIGYTIK